MWTSYLKAKGYMNYLKMTQHVSSVVSDPTPLTAIILWLKSTPIHVFYLLVI